MLKGYLKKAGLAAPLHLDWAHLARRLQTAMGKLRHMRWSAVGAPTVAVVRAHHINAATFSSTTQAKAA